MRKAFLLVAIVAVFALSTQAISASSVYTSYSAWLAATPGDHDAFGTPQDLGALTVNSATTAGSFGAPRGVFPVGTNVWNDRVALGEPEVTTFSDGDGDANTPYYAFGGFWDFSPGGYGQGLTIMLSNGDVYTICGDPAGCTGGALLVPDGTFFGVITSDFFTLSITADGQGGGMASAETFDLSQLDLVHAPEPSSFLLLGSGLAGLAGLIKRKLMA